MTLTTSEAINQIDSMALSLSIGERSKVPLFRLVTTSRSIARLFTRFADMKSDAIRDVRVDGNEWWLA
jgi:hypothetical protein